MFKRIAITCLAASSIGLTATTATAGTYATALLDKTGSMDSHTRTDGKTRCEYGKELFLETVGIGIERADYLNVKTFGRSGEINSLSGGFVDVRGWNRYAGPGKTFFDNIKAQVNLVSCNSSSTALGDALCDSIDELKALNGNHSLRIGLVTDAEENGSNRCGNPGGYSGYQYVYDHIIPKLNAPPPVELNISILYDGNVSFKGSDGNLDGAEEIKYESAPAERSQRSAGVLSSEVEALIEAAELSGGGAIVIGDDEICTSNCDPESQDPDWGGGW